MSIWAEGIWADGIWAAGIWAGGESSPEVVPEIRGAGKRRKKILLKRPRRWSDPEEELLIPRLPEVMVNGKDVATRNVAHELYLALEKRAVRRNRLKKVASIAIAFMDS